MSPKPTAFHAAMQALAVLAPDSLSIPAALDDVARAAPALIPGCTRSAIRRPSRRPAGGRHRAATPPRSAGSLFRLWAPLSVASGGPVAKLDLYCTDRLVRDEVLSDLHRLYSSEPAAPDTQGAAAATADFVEGVAAALATRALMDHATELLMGRGGCTENAAFARLQSWSRLAAVGLSEAATRVVDQHEQPPRSG